MTAHRWDLRNGFPIRDAEHLHQLCTRGMPRYLLGDGERPDALEQPRVAIVGTRAATPYGCADAHDIAAFCARAGITVVSGLAIGIDAAAHEGALDAGGLTVGVVATGLDVVYPRPARTAVRTRARTGGDRRARTNPAPRRCRGDFRCATASSRRSPISSSSSRPRAPAARCITASYARDFGRDVYVLAGIASEPGRRRLQRADPRRGHALLDPADLLFAIGRGGTVEGGWTPPPKPPADRDQRAVLRAMAGHPATITEIEQACGLPAARLGAALRGLERADGSPAAAACGGRPEPALERPVPVNCGRNPPTRGHGARPLSLRPQRPRGEVVVGWIHAAGLPGVRRGWESHGAWEREVREPDPAKLT